MNAARAHLDPDAGTHFRHFGAASRAMYNVDSRDNDITYFYESQLPGESAPVADRHFHPVEPRTLRLTFESHF